MGQYYLQELDRLFLQEFFSDLAIGNEKREIKKYAPKTIREIKSILNMAFEDAVTDRIIQVNPIANIKTPKVPKKKRDAFTTEQIMELMRILLKEGVRGVFYLFILNTGVRSSENGGVKWKHYNYENSEVNIEDGFGIVTLYDDDFNKIETVTEDKDLKTVSSYRTIPLLSWLNELIYYYMQHIMNEKGAMSKAEIDECYMFTNELGNPLTADYLGDTLKDILKKHDFPHTNPRNLRHLFATMCVHAGITINQLRDYLGHALASTTLNYYVDSDKKRNKAGRFVVFHSDDDPYVDLANGKKLSEELGVELNFVPNAGHFNASAGYTEFPDLLKEVMQVELPEDKNYERVIKKLN